MGAAILSGSRMKFVGFEKEDAAEIWARDQLAVKGKPEFFRAMTAVDDNEEFACVVVFTNFTSQNVDLNIAAKKDFWRCPKSVISTFNGIFSYTFHTIKAARVTALIADSNRKSKKFVEHMGFTLEGVMRKASNNNEDVCIYGFLADEYHQHSWYRG
jgi:hypothetical protein